MKFFMISLFLLVAVFPSALHGTSIILAENQTARYAIHLDASVTPMLTLAVRELETYLQKSTGAKFPVSGIQGARQIVLRKNSQLGAEESRISIEKENLILEGGDDRGVLYAVYALLENQLGIRWFSAYGDELIPQHAKLELDFESYRQKPAFPVRSIIDASVYYKHPSSSMFLLRNRSNVGNGLLNPRYPGSDTALFLNGPQCHTLFYYIPPKDGLNPANWQWKSNQFYFASHPEFFAMNQAGERTDAMQLCFSNLDLRKEFTARFAERVETTGAKGVYSISAMDWPGNFCYCPECKKLEKKYQCTAGPLIDYLLELCEFARNKYPAISISTLAYRKGQTEIPPLLSGNMPDNFIAIFAPIDDDFSKTLDHVNNRQTLANLQRWSKIAKVWVWYYPLPYGDTAPFGGLKRTAADLGNIFDSGAKGTYFEHDVGVYQGLNFSDLISYVLLKQFQNPKQNPMPAIREFCQFYYGAAASAILTYWEELENYTADSKDFLIWNGSGLKKAFTPENLIKWTQAFERMEKLTANDARSLAHVRDCRIALDLVILKSDYQKLLKQYPAVFAPVDVVEKRLRNNFEDSIQRRYPASQQAAANVWRNSFKPDLENALLLAKVTPKPLGAPLNAIAPEKIRQIIPVRINLCGFAKADDAAFGQVIFEDKIDFEMPFTCGVYDRLSKRFLLNRKIEVSEIQPDCYKLYKLGEAPIGAAGTLWTMSSWRAGFDLNSLFIPGEAPDKVYEIWLSLKFEGPNYHPDSKATRNRVFMDRAVIVEK